jgi:hypothetical protein
MFALLIVLQSLHGFSLRGVAIQHGRIADSQPLVVYAAGCASVTAKSAQIDRRTAFAEKKGRMGSRVARKLRCSDRICLRRGLEAVT